MIAVLIGTRPELIKMAPVLRKLKEKRIPFVFIHSGQHYSKKMDQQIIKDLKLPIPDFNLQIGSGTQAVQTGKIMEGIERICMDLKPKILVVHGDTNTALAGALAVKKLHVTVAHVEAGIRSFDFKMPEEINRALIDRISDLLFAPTDVARINLLNEGIKSDKIIVVGNTIVDAIQEHLVFSKKSKIFQKLNIKKEEYIIATAHRPENVDTEENLRKLINVLEFTSKKINKIVIWPIHPRTEKQLKEFKIKINRNIKIIPPLGYIDMLALLNYASLVLTDSGGIQEEAYVLKKPLITLRDSTERPETLSANFIVHLDIIKVEKALEKYKLNQVLWKDNIFGNGIASHLIVRALIKFIDKE